MLGSCFGCIGEVLRTYFEVGEVLGRCWEGVLEVLVRC